MDNKNFYGINFLMNVAKTHKILKKYYNSKRFQEICVLNTLQGIEEIAGQKTKIKVQNAGLKKIHNYFPVEHLPFLQNFLEKKLNKIIFSQIFMVAKKNLKIKNNFYIDKSLNIRIHYPFEVEKKSKLTRQIYRCINLNKFKEAEKEMIEAKKKSLSYKLDNNDKSKIEYFNTINESVCLHSPHRDTWFGHSTEGINLWWAVTPARELNGLMLFKDVYKFNLEHEIRPAYVKNKYNLGKTTIPNVEAGELLIFDPEILHASRLNTSDDTRIVISGRINEKKPKFYGYSKENKEPFWLFSEDVKNKIFNKEFIFKREKKNIIKIKKNKLKNEVKLINLKVKLLPKNKYKLCQTKLIKNLKKVEINFENSKIGLIKKNSKFYAFNRICPHLKFNLLNTEGEKNHVICPGHGLKFNYLNGNSTCKKFKIKTFQVLTQKGNCYLKT